MKLRSNRDWMLALNIKGRVKGRVRGQVPEPSIFNVRNGTYSKNAFR